MTPKFSIITPTWNRADGRLQRCIESVQCQTFVDYEHIIVDDGSKDGTNDIVTRGYIHDDWNRQQRSSIRYIRMDHAGRVQARNAGMMAAGGEWICHLDSDDAYDPMYLETFAYHIDRNPDISVFVCGAVYHGMVKEDGKHIVPKWTKMRMAWVPPVDDDGGHSELFRSGRVGTGMFCFKRSCLDVIGLLPDDWINCYRVADGLDGWLGVPEGTTGYSSKTRLVGNPWGEDHALYQKLALNFRIEKIDAALYLQYIR